MLVNIIQNTISSFISAGVAAAEVITTNLKMWLGFETSETIGKNIYDGNITSPINGGTFTNNGDGTFTVTGDGNPSPGIGVRDNDAEYLTVGGTYKFSAQGANTTVAVYDVSYNLLTSGINSVEFQATTSSIKLYISPTNGVTATYSDVEVKELTQITPDKSGNNNVGELFTGKALEFDGSTTYVSANSFAGTLSTSDAFTFAIWFNSDKTPTDFFRNILISSGGPQQFTNIFKIGVNPQTSATGSANVGGIYFDDSAAAYNNVVPSSGGVNYNDGQWHRLVVSRRDGSGVQDLSFYVDGSYIGKADCNPLWNNVNLFDFGQEWDGAGTSDHFAGKMSDIQVYDYAWTTDDIAYDYANPNKLAIDNPSTSLSVTNLKAYWALSEGDGLVAYDSGTNLEEEEVRNGDFSDGFDDWSNGSDWSVANDVATLALSDNATNSTLTSSATLVSSKTYVLTYTISNYTSGELALVLGNISIPSTDGDKTFTFTGQTELSVKRKGGATALSITNISVREITASDHGGIVNGATYVDAQPRIPQLGMMNWAKSTPVANEITLIPNPTIPTQDILGNAVRDRLNSFNLDGSGYAEVAEVVGLDVTDFSIEAWVKFDYTDTGSSTNVIYVNGGVSTSVNTFALATDEDNKVRFIVGGVTLYSTTVFSNNNWVHIAGTRESGALKLYINGNKTPEATGTGNAVVNNTSDLLVGRDTQTNRFYKERISDVRLYGSALSADEVENNYNAGLSAHTN